jgi:ABC-type multidrug transport system permease subunit
VKHFLRSDFIMRIGSLFVIVVAIMTIVITPALIGAVVGVLIALTLSVNPIPAALIGALGGFCSGLAFLLNAGLNGEEKGL